MSELDLDVTALAAGGDGVARDEAGRVTFVPRTAVGDRARVLLVHQTKSFARAQIVDVIAPSADRVPPPCPHFVEGCGGCQWQHIALPAQLAAKHALVTNALRKLEGMTLHSVTSPAPAYGWRRRARFHVALGKLGLYKLDTQDVLPLAQCPQLEPALEAAMKLLATATPPDGELALLIGHTGAIVVGTERAWRGAGRLVGKAGIVGIVAGGVATGEATVELEPGLAAGPWDFAQASAAGNAALVALVRTAVGRGPGELLELHAGSGNFTRGFAADGWHVTASDATKPTTPATAGVTITIGTAAEVLERTRITPDVIVLDPPRVGAAEAIDGLLKLAPPTIVYVSCDPATLARDAGRLVAAGYRATEAWPIDLMPQTSHVEVVMKLVRAIRS